MFLHHDKTLAMLAIAKEYHAHQKRSGNVPYWQHVLSVAEILNHGLEESSEITDQELHLDILLAAIGHDLYEDTSVDPKLIKKQFGQRVHDLIFYLTNEDGDDNRTRYLEKMHAAPDEAKLIKLSDLIENTISVAYCLPELGVTWTRSFYLPIAEEMKENVTPKHFATYPKTARILHKQFLFAYQRLHENVVKFEAP